MNTLECEYIVQRDIYSMLSHNYSGRRCDGQLIGMVDCHCSQACLSTGWARFSANGRSSNVTARLSAETRASDLHILLMKRAATVSWLNALASARLPDANNLRARFPTRGALSSERE